MAARADGIGSPEDPKWIKDYVIGHDNAVATNLEAKLAAEEAAERNAQMLKDEAVAQAAEAERVKEEEAAKAKLKAQLEADEAVALKYQSATDAAIARALEKKLQAAEDAERKAQMEADEKLAKEASEEMAAEQLEAEKKAQEQLQLDETTARKLQGAPTPPPKTLSPEEQEEMKRNECSATVEWGSPDAAAPAIKVKGNMTAEKIITEGTFVPVGAMDNGAGVFSYPEVEQMKTAVTA